jgi:hypothetical protein
MLVIGMIVFLFVWFVAASNYDRGYVDAERIRDDMERRRTK